jgi:hypothetical protein
MACEQCGGLAANPCHFQDRVFCSRVCAHAAGDRTACLGWNCGCTRYAKKRRLLREHRVNMRIMEEVIWEHGLADVLEARLEDETGNTNFWLEHDPEEMDESSDTEDPEQQARA